MTPSVKQNMYAIILAGLLSFGIYQFVLTNPEFLTADIQGIVDTQDIGDIRYEILENQLIVKAGKSFRGVSGISALISFDTTKIQLKTDKVLWYGDVNLTNEDGSVQVTVIPSQADIAQNTELFRIGLWGTDYSQLVVNDVVVAFLDGTSDGVSVGVEN